MTNSEKLVKSGQIGQKLFLAKFWGGHISKTVSPTAFVLLCKNDQKGRFILQKNFFDQIGQESRDQFFDPIASQIFQKLTKWVEFGIKL